MRRPMLAGNWKMFKDAAQVRSFAEDFIPAVKGLDDRDILICPPCLFVQTLAQLFAGTRIQVGAQHIHWEDEGAFTGEISAPMVLSTGATHTLIGHSERRQYFAESDADVKRRIQAAQRHGLTPVVCIGETLEEREAGQTLAVLERQLREGLPAMGPEDSRELILAYEPVWAIGTGKTATPEIAQEAHAFIRKTLAELFTDTLAREMRILYGGSVKPDNIDTLMEKPDIDGALVGGASLQVASFARIIQFKG